MREFLQEEMYTKAQKYFALMEMMQICLDYGEQFENVTRLDSKMQ